VVKAAGAFSVDTQAGIWYSGGNKEKTPMKAWICVFGLLGVIPVWATHNVDFNFDGKIDLADFFLFADVFGHPVNENNEFFDLNGDGAINFPDFYLFADQYDKDIKELDDILIADLPGGATMEFVWIEPGTFTMGSPLSEPGRYSDEGPQHEVTISRGFYLGKYELTQGQWESVMGTTPWSRWIDAQSNPHYPEFSYAQSNPSHPAVYLWWSDMREFIGKLNVAAGERIYRLPTEGEWEYSCRAGTTTRWSFGDDESQLGDFAWYRDNAWNVGLKYAQPVGTKLPNPWGLFDMHGNVTELCQDGSGSYSSSAQVDPLGTGFSHVTRGGSFFYLARGVRSAYRSSYSAGTRYFIGARLLRTE